MDQKQVILWLSGLVRLVTLIVIHFIFYFMFIAGSALREETAEMLIQQGLEEIASVSTSEQIAFLLVERARLLDELEAEQNRTITPSVDGRASEDLQKMLEKERNEFEEEISQQRDSLKKTQDQLKRQHEEEINALMEENNKLEDDLVESKEKVRLVGQFSVLSWIHVL